MNQALWVAKTGLDALQAKMTVVANNLANSNTTAFKKGEANFEDLLYQVLATPGSQTSEQSQSPSGLQIGTGVKIVSTAKTFTQGNLQQTGNSLDVAINGRGFFQITLPDGSLAYTRDGSFQIDSQGQVVNSQGLVLSPGLNIPQGTQSISIGIDGVVNATLAGQSEPVGIGSITIVDFINPSGLLAKGGNLFAETAASGSPQSGTAGQNGFGTLSQGSLESSNVNIVEEMVNMIETQRAYEINSKAIQAADAMLQYTNNNL